MMVISLSFLFCLCFITVKYSYGVDFDYFFDAALRSEKVSCNGDIKKIICQAKCGPNTGLCFGERCYCVTLSKRKYNIDDFTDEITSQISQGRTVDRYDDFHDYNEVPVPHQKDDDVPEVSPDYLDQSLNVQSKPALRHHIAHFCPNLDIARTCIRTCMAVGKPAFCGKDHVCYCGHRYSNKDRDPVANVSSIYSQFKDMYEKYFGPNYKQTLNL